MLDDMCKWIKKNQLVAVLIGFLIADVLLMIYVTLCYNNEGNREAIYKFLRDFGAGCLAVIGSVALLRRAAALDKTAEAQSETAKAQSKAAEAQSKAAEAALQSSEQTFFKDSIESLAHSSVSVRLGGIYNLNALAISNKYRSKEVLEILCAHLRSITKEDKYKKNYARKPSMEINTLLDLLISKGSELRAAYKESSDKECILNFRGAFLNGGNLRDSELKGADLSEVQIQGARLEKARMQGAYLWKAKMQGADLREAQMQGARLANAEMQGVNLSKVQMQGANLQEAQMHGAYLIRTRMQVADLRKAQMQGAFLLGAQMQGANLKDTDLCGGGDDRNGFKHKEFIPRMRDRTDKETSIKTVIFSGGFREEDRKKTEDALKEAAKHFKNHLETGFTWEYIEDRLEELNKLDTNANRNYKIPKKAIIGTWNAEDVNKTIAAYQKAMAWKQDNDKDD